MIFNKYLIITLTLFIISFLKVKLDKINEPYYTEYLINKNIVPSSCSDFIYGCCEIYTGCSYHPIEKMVANITYIDWNANIKFNEKGTNCDRIRDIVIEYNNYQNKELSTKEIFNGVASCSHDTYPIDDCCSLDYNCDLRYYYDFIFIKNDISNYKSFFSSTSGNIVLYPNMNSLLWHMAECPTFEDVIHVYEQSLIYNNNSISYTTYIYYIIYYISVILIMKNIYTC